MHRIVAGFVVAAVVFALGVGIGGGTGRAGLAVFLLITTLGLGVTAVYGMVTALVDEFKDRPVSARRVGWMIGAFVGAAGMMAMVAGVGG
jgi:hypothetical protein